MKERVQVLGRKGSFVVFFIAVHLFCFAQPMTWFSPFAKFDTNLPSYIFAHEDYLFIALDRVTEDAQKKLEEELKDLKNLVGKRQEELEKELKELAIGPEKKKREIALLLKKLPQEPQNIFFETLEEGLSNSSSILIMKSYPGIMGNWVVEREVPLVMIKLLAIGGQVQAEKLYGALQIRAIAPYPGPGKKILVLTDKGLVVLDLTIDLSRPGQPEVGPLEPALLKTEEGKTIPMLSDVSYATPYQNKCFLHLAMGDVDNDGTDEIVLIYGDINPKDVYKEKIKEPEIYVEVLKLEKDAFVEIASWRNQPIFREEEKVPGYLGYLPSFVTVADIDKDGDKDIIIANSGYVEARSPTGDVELKQDVTVHVILSHRWGVKIFDNPRIVSIGHIDDRPRSVIVEDFDGDGFKDIVIAGRSKLVRVSGAEVRTVEPGQTVQLGEVVDDDFPNDDVNSPAILQAADLNMDGSMDIIAYLPKKNELAFYKSGATKRILLSGQETSLIAVADTEQNRAPDILIVDANTQSLKVLTLTGSGSVVVNDLALMGLGAYHVIEQPLKTGKPESLTATVLAAQFEYSEHMGYYSFAGMPACDATGKTIDEYGVVAQLSKWQFLYYFMPLKWEVFVGQAPAYRGTPPTKDEKPDGSLIVFDKRTESPTESPKVPKVSGVEYPVSLLALTNFYVDQPKEPTEKPTGRDALLVLFRNGKVRCKALPSNLQWTSWAARYTGSPTDFEVPLGPDKKTLDGKMRWLGVGDTDQDGWDDVVVFVAQNPEEAIVAVSTRAARKEWRLYTFSARDIVTATLADLDSDGSLDLILLDRHRGSLFVLWGKLDTVFSFESIQEVKEVGNYPTGLAVGSRVVAVVDSEGVKIIRFDGRRVSEIVKKPLTVSGALLSIARASRPLDWLVPRSTTESATECVDFVVSCYSTGELHLVRVTEEDAKTYSIANLGEKGCLKALNVVGKDITEKLQKRNWKLPGISSVTLADVDGDGEEEIIVAWPFSPDRLSWDEEITSIFADAAKETVKGELAETWESVIIFDVSGEKPPPLSTSVFGAREKEGFFWFVLSNFKAHLDLHKVRWSGLLGAWEVVTTKRITNCSPSTHYYIRDLNADGYAELLALMPGEGLCTWWGPDYVRKEGLPIPIDPQAFALGVWSEGTSFISGKTGFFLPKAGRAVVSVPLDLNGEEIRSIFAREDVNARSPPDFVLVVSDFQKHEEKILVYRGTDFSAAQESWPRSREWSLPRGGEVATAGDYDRDGVVDVVVIYKDAKQGEVWFGNGQKKEFDLYGLQIMCISTGDMNNDGYEDILLLGGRGSLSQLRFIYGAPTGELVPTPEWLWPPILSEENPIAVNVQDVDGDRKVDVSILLIGRVLNYISSLLSERTQFIHNVRFDNKRLELKK